MKSDTTKNDLSDPALSTEHYKLIFDHAKHLTTLSGRAILVLVTFYDRPSRYWKTLIAVSLISLMRLTFLLMPAAVALGQTSVVIMRTADEIVIAADSLAVARNDKGEPLSDKPYCKILVLEGNLFFAAAGTVEFLNSSYNLRELVKRARHEGFPKGDSIKAIGDRIHFAVLPALNESMEKMSPERRKRLTEFLPLWGPPREGLDKTQVNSSLE